MSQDSGLGEIFGLLYGVGGMLSFVYFSWQFIKENDFITYLLLGEIVPICKAVVWPVFLF